MRSNPHHSALPVLLLSLALLGCGSTDTGEPDSVAVRQPSASQGANSGVDSRYDESLPRGSRGAPPLKIVTQEEFTEFETTAADESQPQESRQQATKRLAEHGMAVSQVKVKWWGTVRKATIDEQSVETLRDLIQSSNSPQVRAAAADGLGNMVAIDSVDLLLVALNDEEMQVREAAHRAISNILGTKFEFSAGAAADARQAAIDRIREVWLEKQQNEYFMSLKRDPAVVEEHKRKIVERYRQSPPGKR